MLLGCQMFRETLLRKSKFLKYKCHHTNIIIIIDNENITMKCLFSKENIWWFKNCHILSWKKSSLFSVWKKLNLFTVWQWLWSSKIRLWPWIVRKKDINWDYFLVMELKSSLFFLFGTKRYIYQLNENKKFRIRIFKNSYWRVKNIVSLFVCKILWKPLLSLYRVIGHLMWSHLFRPFY